MPGVPLKGCQRGNGDGLTTTPNTASPYQKFCECACCRANRWLAMKLLRGQLAPAQESAVRECIRALGGEA